MDANFSDCLKIILKEEGGNDDDKDDPGGRTSRGIIQREWNVFRQTHPNRPADVWQAAQGDIDSIYHDQYWEPYCDRMPSGIDLVFFNTAVNSGRQQAVKELQRALGFNPADGMMGMITFQALDDLKSLSDVQAVIHKLSDQRRAFYKSLKTFWKYGKGWLARTDRVESAAIALSAKVAPKVIASEYPQVDTKPKEPEVTVSPKAPASGADKPTIPPEAGGAIAAGTGSLAGVLAKIQEQLSAFSSIEYVQYALLAITVISIIYMVFGMVKNARVKAAMGNV